MSLLMDALKKAEQEKREAAKRLEEAREKALGNGAAALPEADITSEFEVVQPAFQSAPRELSLEPRTEPPPEPEPRASITGPIELIAPPAGVDSGLEIEPVEAATPAAGAPSAPTPAEAREFKSPLEFIEEIGPEAMADFDQTFHGVALKEQPVPGLYEETLPGAVVETPEPEPQRSYDQTLPGVPAAQLARDIGPADQPTPAAAQTVFTAGQARPPDRLYKWGLPAAGVALLVAASIYIYYYTTPVTPNTPSPWVARGIEAIPAPSEPPPQLPAGTETAMPQTDETQAPQPGPADADAVAAVEPPASVPPAAAVTEAATPAEAPAAELPATEPPVEEPQFPAAVAAAPLPPEAAMPEPSQSLVRISRTRSPSEHDRMIREAYSFYRAGDFDSATIHYLAVLNERPESIDALLGMGAIAMKRGDSLRAVEYFSRVLQLDPRNQTAAGALIGLQRNADPIASESTLKHLLQENPDAPFLYFMLGNVYAAQARWPEAQQAFFDAYRNDSANPDYALNLAASLDRLGQLQPALDFYGVALKLAESQSAGFDVDKVRARMQTLSAGGGQAQ